MKVFLSYASEDREVAEAIYLSLHGQGHTVFFDRANLPPGQEYDARIRRGIERSQLFLFLISPYALDAGSYTLTELGIAQQIWRHPAGRVLPVVVRSTAQDRIPPYLKSVTWLEPEGNVTATVADAVNRIAVARRGVILRTVVKGLAIASIVGAAAYFYLANRDPADEITGADGTPAVAVPVGNFTMGDDEESPLREIFLDAFYLDKYEVTVSRYANFLKTTGGVTPPDGWEQASLESANELPVVGVDWHDADAYCKWAGKRLPTEAEWEKAARGTDGRSYPWGKDEPTSSRANFGKSSKSPYQGGLMQIGGRPGGSSPYGVEDLAGNAAEWVADWFAAGFRRGDVRNPQGPESGTAKVIRGGGWHDPPDRLKASRRAQASPGNRADDVGFRCAKDLRR